ncbi:MAG: molybdopterin molybdotransferase MoeA [Phenylobacterium sp.]|nr:MAG: molybdopterin molybdotransferase MoeA [Phenylobacterium sp.]
MKLLSVDEARARMLAEIAALPAESVALADSVGRVLAEEIRAVRDQPPFPASAMDGWAVRAADCPESLKIVGESAAGHGFEGRVGAGEAVRIFTGAAIPDGCDAIVIQEDAERTGDEVRVPEVAAGHHVRPAGLDFKRGETLLEPGVRIDAWRLSLAASAGRAEVAVHGRPRVALLSTGEEIVEAPAAPGPFQIYDSGAPALAVMIEGWGAAVTRSKPVRDQLEAVVAAMRGAEAELIVTVGGASVGDHDLVRAAGEALGMSYRVESVAVRPGKPTFFGVLADGRRLLGLPGNPASAFVCAEMFLRPILAAYQGALPDPVTITAKLAAGLPANGPREHWMRAKLSYAEGEVTIRPYRDQDSSLISVFAASDALLRRQAGAAALPAGAVVEALPLSRA